ncbi:MAG TPA: hypothetical protein VN455_07135, partial [Methanotrichaceae archaeon]|nr:hypothetical protein [Methanotrichaceae archaeon]
MNRGLISALNILVIGCLKADYPQAHFPGKYDAFELKRASEGERTSRLFGLALMRWASLRPTAP